jgi:hypothetical protein
MRNRPDADRQARSEITLLSFKSLVRASDGTIGLPIGFHTSASEIKEITMKVLATILTAISIAGLASGTATAACKDGTSADTTASINAEKPGIAKDGTKAPLETGNNAASKDGQTMPLANQQGGGDENLATSQQDAEAQQSGEQTAAAKADDCVVE